MSSHFNCVGYALAAAVCGLAAPGLAATLYSQPSDGTACDTSCWTSTYGADGTGGYQASDDFSVSSNANVTEVSWYGFYINSADPGANPQTPTTTSWEIDFFANDAGVPGTEVYSTTIAVASVTATFLGDTSALGDTVPFYEFTATLPTTFSASAGTTYWFSPLSNQPSFNPFFSWSPSSVGDGVSAQADLPGSVNLDSEGVYNVSDDRAFTLYGTYAAVPEPAAWTLMLAGVAGLGATLRRSRRGKLVPA